MVADRISIYLETGAKKAFAAGLDWPGWCRFGRDEGAACAALLAYAPRYARCLNLEGIPFSQPSSLEQFEVVERLEGNATTDFGAPNVPLAADSAPISAQELRRLQAVLSACWKALAQAVQMAERKALQTGPRGGGRSLERTLAHVLDAEGAYLRSMNRGQKLAENADLLARIEAIRAVSVETLGSVVRDGLPEKGPRGGKIWLPRAYVRRSAWHILDHAWELEDRILPES